MPSSEPTGCSMQRRELDKPQQRRYNMGVVSIAVPFRGEGTGKR